MIDVQRHFKSIDSKGQNTIYDYIIRWLKFGRVEYSLLYITDKKLFSFQYLFCNAQVFVSSQSVQCELLTQLFGFINLNIFKRKMRVYLLDMHTT